MIRIAFTFIDGSNWKGGHHYLLNLIRLLNLYQKDSVIPILFIGEEYTTAEIAPFQAISGIEIVRTSLLNKNRRVYSLTQALLLGRDVALRGLFDLHRIDSVFEAAQFFGWNFGLPAIAWIPDFQHLALPGLFSALARWKRDIGFRAQVLGRRIIMLSSEDARRTCEANYLNTRGYTRTVRFAVPSGPDVSIKDARKIANDYGLPEYFFYMPNQFWRHKNHIRVLEALAILRQQGVPNVVVASGKKSDSRDPGYSLRLQALVKQHGVENVFYSLGLIPYSHVRALMVTSVALLNPSLFEGGSTTVEEARALGIPMVLSDLDVHKEQMGEKATYFDRYSSKSLANVLKCFQPLNDTKRKQHADEAKCDAKQRIRHFSEEFTSLVKSCVHGWNG